MPRRQDIAAMARRSPTVYHAFKAVQAAFLALRRVFWKANRRPAIASYIRGHSMRKLQIGTGQFPTPGWLNTDVDPTLWRASAPEGPPVIFLDATRTFPFGDATFHYVYLEHLIEHLSYDTAGRMLAECHRVLRPGGRIRIATPDLTLLLDLYQHRNDPSPEEATFVQWVADTLLGDRRRAAVPFVLNNHFRAWGHQFLFDEETLCGLLAAAGFTAQRRYRVGESDDPELRGLETHARAVGDDAMNTFETMVVEAVRVSAESRRGDEASRPN
jgi:predicted SAM-dependent methyltransferase